MVARRLLSSLAACALLAGCGGSEPDDARPVPQRAFGVNAQLLQPLPTVGQEAELTRHLEALSGLGADFARANLDWRIIEPQPPDDEGRAYDFATTDAWVAALARAGMRWQVTGQGGPTPLWAADPAAVGTACEFIAPPARAADFAELMAAVARRYGRGGEFWREHPELPRQPVVDYEIWNEPNFANFWCGGPDPEAYGRLYAQARAAIHRVDPGARVLFGGLAAFREDTGDPAVQMPADEFLRRALAAMGPSPAVDVLAVHPYGQEPADVVETLGWFRAIADAAGLEDVPLSVNEFGWRTAGQGPAPLADEETRAAHVSSVLPAIVLSSCDVSAAAVHTWITREENPVDPEHWYGIADPLTAEPYPTATAYGETVMSLEAGDSEPNEALADPCS